jgi:hypothetical protein
MMRFKSEVNGIKNQQIGRCTVIKSPPHKAHAHPPHEPKLINITAFYATPHYTTRLRQFRFVAGLHKSIMLNSRSTLRSPTLKIGRCTCLNGEVSPNPSGFSVMVFADPPLREKKEGHSARSFFSLAHTRKKPRQKSMADVYV